MEKSVVIVHGEESKFTKVDQIDLYDDSIGYVQLWDASHSNESEAQRIHTVTQLGSIAYGNEEAKNPEALYKRLQELKHESLWEFIRDGLCSEYEVSHGISRSMRNCFDYIDEYELTDCADNHKQNIACFRIKVPIFVARQFMRHRSFSYIEMSRRYTKDSKVPFEFYEPFKEKGGIINSKFNKTAIDHYKELVDNGVHTQEASRVLPQMTYTEFYCMMEIEGARNFFELRCSTHAQHEIRVLSVAILKLLNKHQKEMYEKVKPKDFESLLYMEKNETKMQ